MDWGESEHQAGRDVIVPREHGADEAAGALELPPGAAALVFVELLLLELQAVMASSAALSAAIESVVLRMRRYAFPLWRPLERPDPPTAEFVRRCPVNVVRANISHGGGHHGALIPTRYHFLSGRFREPLQAGR